MTPPESPCLHRLYVRLLQLSYESSMQDELDDYAPTQEHTPTPSLIGVP